MANATITSVTGQGTASYNDGTDMDMVTTGGYCVEAAISTWMDDVRVINSPGITGGGTKDFFGGSQEIRIKVQYIGSSEQDCFSKWDTDSDSWAGPCTVTVGSTTYGTAKNGKGGAKQPRSTGLATYVMDAEVTFEVIR